MNDAINVMSCNHQARRRGNVLLQVSDISCGPRCHVSVLSPPILRLAVFLLLLASVVDPAAVGHRPTASSYRGPTVPSRYHHRQLIDGQLEAWQVARCRQQEHYIACFLCGKMVQSRDVYYGCCRMHLVVLMFCDKLLAWQRIVSSKARWYSQCSPTALQSWSPIVFVTNIGVQL